MSKKGQLFSMDLVVSLVAFSVVLLFLFGMWNLYSVRLNENIASADLSLTAFQVTDTLIKSKGFPSTWENDLNNISTIGLNSYPGALDQNKVNTFLTMDYNYTKEIFNIERMDFQFRIFDSYGNEVNSIGIAPTDDASESITITRIILIDGTKRKILFTLWRTYNG
ncbi:MAG: hypothetical protein Q8Q35_03855 [Nanoarchaeota archaeon]|nr:hypothetical protein [Nanoarchaeota archaeon]